jgi:hypothetical protein
MPQSSTIIVVPLIVAILTFLAVFYGRERAYSIRSHNFISAVAALVYLVIAVAFAIWALICTRI